jgi:hypothetical protein
MARFVALFRDWNSSASPHAAERTDEIGGRPYEYARGRRAATVCGASGTRT